MPCNHCGAPQTSRRAKSKYCSKCYAHLYADEARLGRLPAYHPFVGERRLNDEQIELIQKWVAGGAVSGAAAALPQMPVFQAEGWQLST